MRLLAAALLALLAAASRAAAAARPSWLLAADELWQGDGAAALPPSPAFDATGAPLALARGRLPLPRDPAAPAGGSGGRQGAAAAARPELAEAAAEYGLSAVQLLQLLQSDGDLLLTRQGLLVWACSGGRFHRAADASAGPAAGPPLLPAAAGQAAAGPGADAWARLQLPPPELALQLHSRPPPRQPQARAAGGGGGATGAAPWRRIIYLCFTGCSVSGTYWNAALNASSLAVPPFDLDGRPDQLSQAERQAIVEVWAAVAQDWAPWDIDVTTEEPPAGALERTDEEDTVYGMRVCIGGSSTELVGGEFGGLAFTGAWGQVGPPTLQPALVFPEQLGRGYVRAVADSISHEVGHTMGLAHFAGHGGAAPYDEGQGAVGPLMGQPYLRPLSQWHAGPSAAAALQDDLAVIGALLGSPLADGGGRGGGAAGGVATLLCARGPQGRGPAAAAGGSTVPSCWQDERGGDGVLVARAAGTVSSAADQHSWEFEAAAGPAEVLLQLPRSAGSAALGNLVASVTLMQGPSVRSGGAAGAPVAAPRPLAAVAPASGSEVDLRLSAELPSAGRYHVVVAPASPPGGSTYGSLGDYALLVRFPGGRMNENAAALPGATEALLELMTGGMNKAEATKFDLLERLLQGPGESP